MVYAGEPGVFQIPDVTLLEEASAQITFGLEHLASEEQRRKLEAELFQTQKMESLGSLAGGVAHDINNVLGAILGLASANLEIQPAGTPVHRAFETISKAATRGGEMVKRLLRFARQNASELVILDVNALLQEQVHLLERTTLAKVRLELDLADDLGSMRGDASALAHAIMNLCVNAVDAMPANGTLMLRTRNLGSDWLEIQVEDTGRGMPKEILDRALDPFFTTKEQGTGLGLAIVYSTVKAHGGRLEIQSQPGQGTCVRLQFPAFESGPRPELAPEAHSTLAPGCLQVLLVDDDDLILSAIQATLEVLGHQVTVASRGEVALGLLDDGFRPDVIILDMNMPGLGGSGTLPLLRALQPTVPVLLATGRIDSSALALGGAYPGVSLLPKPFTMKELKASLETLGSK